jgi:putative lipoprotein
VSGTVTYRERMALPPGTLVNVQLQDVSLADAPATVIGEQDIVIEDEQVPIPFEIAYDPDDIEDNHTYVVRAEIRDADGSLLFTTDTSYPVITRDNPTEGVEIVVVAVGR